LWRLATRIHVRTCEKQAEVSRVIAGKWKSKCQVLVEEKPDDLGAMMEHLHTKFLTCHIQGLFQAYSSSQTSTNECKFFMEVPEKTHFQHLL
jgi:hypothetical protein